MDAAFAEVEKTFGTIDFVVHAIAFANKDELKGRSSTTPPARASCGR